MFNIYRVLYLPWKKVQMLKITPLQIHNPSKKISHENPPLGESPCLLLNAIWKTLDKLYVSGKKATHRKIFLNYNML